MTIRPSIAVVLALAAGATGGACSSPDASSSRGDRGADVVEACRAHGGVTAFDDDAVVCRDATSRSARGARAVDACRGHGGVSAFDDDIVVCRDQSFRGVPEN
jgi:hypothetical protein